MIERKILFRIALRRALYDQIQSQFFQNAGVRGAGGVAGGGGVAGHVSERVLDRGKKQEKMMTAT